MKRFAPLLFVVLALAVAAPIALADDSTPPPAATTTTTTTTAGTAPAAPQAKGHPFARMRLEILRLRIQLVHLRYRIVCHDTSSDACATFTQKIVDRLTTVDKNVQAKLAQLDCSSSSADKRCAVLAKVDAKLQKVIAKLSSPSSSSSSSSDSSSDSSLDQAANALGNLAGGGQQP
jgi:hypothetical protein